MMDLQDTPGRTAPFRAATSIEDAVPHRSWREAQSQAMAAFLAGKRVICITGATGSGKTLLLHYLVRTLSAEGWQVGFLQPGQPVAEMSPDSVAFVDDADQLGWADLDTLRKRPDLTWFISASPSFAERLAEWPGTVAIRLEPLCPTEVARFVKARLAASGQPTNLLSADAVAKLALYSAGVPRVINAVGGMAYFLAALDRAPDVAAGYVERAIALREGDLGQEEEVNAAAGPATRVPEPGPSAPAKEQSHAAPSPESEQDRSRPRRVIVLAALGITGLAFAVFLAHGLATRNPAQQPGTPSAQPGVPLEAGRPAPAASASPAFAGPVKQWTPTQQALNQQPSRATSAAPLPPPISLSPPSAAVAAGPRVVIHYLAGSPAAAAGAERIAPALSPQFGAIEARVVPDVPRILTIRYFYDEDRRAARTVGKSLPSGFGRWRLQNYSGFRPRPRPGTLEIWLPDH